MNELIINGIDHSVFDLEWAKRGGVLVSLESENTRINVFKFLRSVTAEKIEVSTMSQLCFVTNFYEYRRVFRMATPDECATAGIEYIEPPMMWRDIESAPRDVLVLVKTDKSKVGCAIFESKTECEYFGLNPIDGTFIHWMPLPRPYEDKNAKY